MTLTVATLLPALVFLVAGLLLFINNSATVSLIRGFPRSQPAAVVLFGGAAVWFLWVVRGLSEADLIFFQSPVPVMIFFGLLALAAFYYVPDFLAVRGLCGLVLLGAWPILMTFYGEYDKPQRLAVVAVLYLVLMPLALWLGASPYRMRDFLDWLYRTPGRARVLGGVLLAYGLALGGVAFTY
ncbi:hypothetical protein [Nibricoccus sp. IMCC34717]|uniref:hypothetical protein n=1 Tax=Nibricoccus sp. IMCC34717 TaxID=3034021 RepID=UPI00384F47A5